MCEHKKFKSCCTTTFLLRTVMNESPGLQDVSLNSDDDNDTEDIDSIVRAYRRQHRPAVNQWHADTLCSLLLIGLSLGVGGVASWLAVSSSWPLVGLLAPVAGFLLLLIGWLPALVLLRRRNAVKTSFEQLIGSMAALLLLGFHLAQFLMVKPSGGMVYSLILSLWLGLGLLVFHVYSLYNNENKKRKRAANVLTVATIS